MTAAASGPPSAADLTRGVPRAFEEAAPGYDTGGVAFFAPVAARLVELAALPPGARVLDAGCGTGAVLLPAAAAVGPAGQVTGIDLAEGMLSRAAAEASRRGLSWVSVQQADAGAPPFPAGSFDAVLASNLLGFLPEPPQAARHYLDLLEDGGIFAFTWNVAEDPRWLAVFDAAEAYLPDGVDGFVDFLHRPPFDSVMALEDMLTQSGYTEVSTAVEPVLLRYREPDQWWTSSWNQAPRVIWQHIPPSDRPSARDAAVAEMERLRHPDGTLSRTITFGYTVARRGGPAA
jgi:ubiquinone/menaquinone biosynthesis C-methylase UbiE